jgi:hypothetical protein
MQDRAKPVIKKLRDQRRKREKRGLSSFNSFSPLIS